jgi:DNA repair protein RadC
MEDFKKGHRKRLIEKVFKSGRSSSDVELLEAILFLIYPRKDVKNVAHAIWNRYKSFFSIMNASKVDIIKVPDVGVRTFQILSIIFTLFKRMCVEKLKENSISITNNYELLDYCRVNLETVKKEMIIVLFLNAKNILIEEKFFEGTINQVQMYPREIIALALELSALSIILIHNHPSGNPTPSEDDIHTTKNLKISCNSIGINLYEHIVVGRNGNYFSFKKNGLL